jgi:hypothetical protein
MSSRDMTTRTMESTIVEVLCMDLVEQKPLTQVITLPKKYSDDTKIMKALKSYDTDELKIVSIINVEVKKELRGITDELFLKYSVVLDENRKPIETEEVQE